MFLLIQNDEHGAQWSTSTQQQRSYRVLENKLLRKVDSIRWTSCTASCNTGFESTGLYLWGHMRSNTYHTGKPETRK